MLYWQEAKALFPPLYEGVTAPDETAVARTRHQDVQTTRAWLPISFDWVERHWVADRGEREKWSIFGPLLYCVWVERHWVADRGEREKWSIGMSAKHIYSQLGRQADT